MPRLRNELASFFEREILHATEALPDKLNYDCHLQCSQLGHFMPLHAMASGHHTEWEWTSPVTKDWGGHGIYWLWHLHIYNNWFTLGKGVQVEQEWHQMHLLLSMQCLWLTQYQVVTTRCPSIIASITPCIGQGDRSLTEDIQSHWWGPQECCKVVSSLSSTTQCCFPHSRHSRWYIASSIASIWRPLVLFSPGHTIDSNSSYSTSHMIIPGASWSSVMNATHPRYVNSVLSTHNVGRQQDVPTVPLYSTMMPMLLITFS